MVRYAKWTVVRDSRGSTYYAPLATPREEVDGTATQVMMWYNFNTRDWVVSFADAMGQQVGSSEYVYSKEDALELASYMQQEPVR